MPNTPLDRLPLLGEGLPLLSEDAPLVGTHKAPSGPARSPFVTSMKCKRLPLEEQATPPDASWPSSWVLDPRGDQRRRAFRFGVSSTLQVAFWRCTCCSCCCWCCCCSKTASEKLTFSSSAAGAVLRGGVDDADLPHLSFEMGEHEDCGEVCVAGTVEELSETDTDNEPGNAHDVRPGVHGDSISAAPASRLAAMAAAAAWSCVLQVLRSCDPW
mmetsp:Transcript_128953/g.257488  ORF Transcript_128953/g.257488 Transcript_128953/m.257488 type:complete len:214 (-) Transcript_128953:81-722(-)